MEQQATNNTSIAAEHEVDDLNARSLSLRHLDGNESLRLAHEALSLSEKRKYELGTAKAILNIGFQQLINAHYDKAFSSFTRSLQLFTEAKFLPGIAHASYDLGVLYSRLGNYENAMEAQQSSLAIRKSLDDEDGVAACKSQTAYINAQFGLNENALREYDECIQIWRRNGNQAGLGSALMALGNLKNSLNDLPAAKEHLIESLTIRKALNEITGILGSSNYLADVLLKEGNTQEAHDLLTEALSVGLAQPNPFAPGICRLRTFMAKASIQMNDAERAIHHLEKALELALETRQLYQLHDIYYELAKLYKSSGRYDRALEYYEQFHEAKQNVINLNAAAKLKNLDMLNKIEIREKEIEIHRLSNVELKQRNKIIKEERRRSEELLLNILPRTTANELKKNGVAKTRYYEMATVLFTDFVNFTAAAEKLSPKDLVSCIHTYFCKFDEIMTQHNIEKIKTIGDAYMAVSGVPTVNKTHAEEMVIAALKVVEFVQEQNNPLFKIRVGIHSGPVVAGVVGNKKFAYDIWGDTVNVASRMESSGESGKVNISGPTYELVKNKFDCSYRGRIEAKRKGNIDMYFVERKLIIS